MKRELLTELLFVLFGIIYFGICIKKCIFKKVLKSYIQKFIRMKNSFKISIKSVLLASLLSFVFFSCQPEANKNESTQEIQATEVETESKVEKSIEVSFSISTIEDDVNGNESIIMATINGNSKEITRATNCNEAETESYESMNIPNDAIWACTCWWAGAGENFYAKKNGDKVEFYGKEVYEEMEEENNWELIKTID